ncbi:MAG: hypothetical protein ABR928_04450, partial [Terracidiphilus sp.]
LDEKRIDAVSDFGPELVFLVVDKPQAAAIGADKVAREIRVQARKLFDPALAADARSMLKDSLSDAIRFDSAIDSVPAQV